MYTKELVLKDGKVQVEDVRRPAGEGSHEERMKKLEQEVFTYKKMTIREMDIFHKMVAELTAADKNETEDLWEDIFSLHSITRKLQAQLYDVQNQNFEYETRFKRISFSASFSILETKSSFVDGEPLPWKIDDDVSPPPPKE